MIEAKTLIKIFSLIDELNGAVKLSVPFQKSQFYTIKAAAIRWAMINTNCVDIQGVQKDARTEYIKLTVTFEDRVYKFHQIWNDDCQCFVKNVCRYPEPEALFEPMEIATYIISDPKALWKELLKLLEENRWFIFDYYDPQSWLKVMNSFYGIKWKAPIKLSYQLVSHMTPIYADKLIGRFGDIKKDPMKYIKSNIK